MHTDFSGTAKQVHRITLETISEEESLRVLRALLSTPQTLCRTATPAGVTKAATARFGVLAKRAQARGNEPHAIAHFLMQVLFSLFAEDIGLPPNPVFSRLLDLGRADTGAFQAQTQKLLNQDRTLGQES